mgnify:CR=1 FL=1
MRDLIVLKLGGSVITDKQRGNAVVRVRLVKRLAREVSEVCFPHAGRRKPPHLVILYGGGSFGHPLAHRYRLSGRKLSKETLVGAGRTISAMRELGTRLAGVFLDAGVPVVPLQTSSFVEQKRGSVVIKDYSLIETILERGGVPLLGGDVVIADRRQTAIASADTLASALAKHFHSRRLLFATDVDGVYEHFPPRAGERPLSVIRRRALRALAAPRAVSRRARDVTGAMGGKIRSLLSLRSCEVLVFSGLTPGALAGALRGKRPGTRIVL